MLPKIPNIPSSKVLAVVLKCTTQVMPGIKKWVDVQVLILSNLMLLLVLLM